MYEDSMHSREKKIIRDAIYDKCKGKLDLASFNKYLRCAFLQDTYRFDIITDEEMAAVVSWVCEINRLVCNKNRLIKMEKSGKKLREYFIARDLYYRRWYIKCIKLQGTILVLTSLILPLSFIIM